jgi:hypothetical protein
MRKPGLKSAGRVLVLRSFECLRAVHDKQIRYWQGASLSARRDALDRLRRALSDAPYLPVASPMYRSSFVAVSIELKRRAAKTEMAQA